MRQLYAQTSMRLVTQNVRGLTPEKLKMIIHTIKDRGIHAAALQEARVNLPVNNDRLLAAVLAGTRLCRGHKAPFHNLSTTCPDGARTGRRNRL